ncbi:MAG: hypothetical protein HY904_20320 [Deltaproteobacteria bacterium]|nr:hypothetical protein [Deltaproteobacteria bacterium]
MLRRSSLVLLSAFTLLAASCSSDKGAERNSVDVTKDNKNLAAGMNNGPDWTRSDTAGSDKDMACAAGTFPNAGDISIAREGAQARGRAALAERIKATVKTVADDYKKATLDGKSAEVIQSFEKGTETFVDQAVVGARMADSWLAADGTFWARMCMSKEDMEASGKAPGLDGQVRDFIDKSKNLFFEKLQKKL